MSERLVIHGFAVFPGRDKNVWLVSPATRELSADNIETVNLHDLSGFLGSRVAKMAIFVPSRDGEVICSEALSEANNIASNLNNIGAWGFNS